MATPDTGTPTAPARARWQRRAAWTAGAIALLLLAIVFAVPPIAKARAEKALAAATGRTATIERLSLNPFKLIAKVEGFTLGDRSGPAPLLTIRELTANMSMASLWRWAPVFDAIRIVEPRANLVRNAGGDYNVQDLIDTALAPSSGPAPEFSLNNIEIVDGAIAFDDRPVGRKHAVTGLDVDIPFLSSLPVDVAVRVMPKLHATVNGTAFTLAGTTTPFGARRAAALDIVLDGLPLPDYVGYLPVKLRVPLAGGVASTRLKLTFADGDAKTRALTLTGDAQIDGLSLLRADGAPLVAAQRVAVRIAQLDVFGRKMAIDSAQIEAPAVDLRRAPDGTIELQQPLVADAAPAAASAPAPGPAVVPAPPWDVRVKALHIAGGTLRLADNAVSPPFRAALSALELDASDIALPGADAAKVKLSFATDLGATVSADGTLVPATLAAQGRIEMTKLALARLYPYYGDALNLEVGSGTLDFAGSFAYAPDPTAPRLTVTDGAGALTDVKLALPGEQQPLWRMAQLTFAGIAVDTAARRVDVGEAATRGAFASIRRDKDGTLNVARLMKTSTTTGRGDEDTWVLNVRKAVLAGVGADIEDRAASTPVNLRVRELGGTLENFTNARGKRGSVNLRAKVGERGRIAIAGPVATNPFAINAEVEADGIALVPLQPYLDGVVNITLTAGTVGAKGRLAYGLPDGAAVDAPRRASYAGDVAISDFAALDTPTAGDLAKWKSMTLTGVDAATSPPALAIGALALDDFFARIIVYNDATLNLARLLTPGAAPAPDAPATTAPPAGSARQPAAPRKDLPIRIGRIAATRGAVQFSDFFVKPNYSANLTDVAGTVSAMSAAQAGDIDIAAKVDRTAPVAVKGRINPFARELTLDLAGDARDIELSPLSPYAAKYAGYGIQKGKLSFTVEYKVDDRKLHARNKLVLDQLTFGERVESPTATKLPVLLAVALLKDRRGVIDIELPIEGSLDDPEFSVGGLIVKVIVNLITRAVTAPFALLGALAGGGPELSYIDYPPGSAALAPPAEAKLKALAKALIDRPGLRLEMTGRVDPAADRAALETDALEGAIKAQKLKALAAAGNAPASPAEVSVAADERNRLLAAAYREAPIAARPRNAAGQLEDVPPAQMEALLRKNAAGGDEALRALGLARAEAAKEALAALEVPGERLFLVAPKPVGEGNREPGAARVDFSLR